MAGRLPISPNTETVLLFGSQALSFDQPAFRKLSSTVLGSEAHSWALRTIEELPEQWEVISQALPSLSAARGAAHLPELGNWLRAGSLGVSHLPNILLSPLVVITQLTQYTTYASLREPEALPASEAVGFCIGLLSATVISSSATKREFEKNAAVAVRLAMLIGAAVDAQDAQDESGESTTLTAAAKSPKAREGVADVMLQFPDAYVSVAYDENCTSITTPRKSASALEQALKAAGCIVANIGLCGRFHSQKHAPSVQQIRDFCDSNSDFSLPDAASLRTPLRSNSGGDFVESGSLHGIALNAILVDRAEWHKTFAQVKSARLADKEAKVVCFGPERCVPPSLLRGLGPQVLYFEDLSLLPRSPDEIAVIGMSINVAGADDAGEFWQLLAEGKSQHKPVPRDRFGFDTVFRENDKNKTWYGNFVNHHDAFDHKFFKKTPRESASMDPQQRLFMQVAYQAVEQSGYFESATADPQVGCYVGVCGTDYDQNVACHPAGAFSATGNLRGFIAGKVSHYFGWTGPGLTVDTACSGSAVAVHQACRAILSGECTAALAGGTNLMSQPLIYQNLAGASFLSPTGQCKPFDALADGYCRGEAVAAVFLKKMSAAIADGDQILGVLSSTAVYQNQNCTPIVVPNASSLSDLFSTVLHRSGLESNQVSVVEAHGTGTPVGDPAEYESVRRVFGGPSRTKPLQLGSVKGLVGHTEGTSGTVSLVKILLMMQEGRIPPQPSFSKINPAIKATPADNMQISTSLQPWDVDFKAALINNYGASGSNASMLVTQAPKLGKPSGSAPAGIKYPFWLCGLDDRSIRAYATRFRRFLKTTDASIADLSFNVARQSNRSLERALIFTAGSADELDQKLAALEGGDSAASPVALPSSRPVILSFGGQISTSIGLDRQVYDNVAILRGYLDRCDATARSLGVGSIYPFVFQKEPIEDIVCLQTALFALQYSTAKSWIDCGVKPAAVVGHSFGELSALCISGVLSLRDAMKAVTSRATAIRDAWGPEKGSMLVVEAGADEVNEVIAASGTPATIACYNSPTSHTVAGSVKDIDTVAESLGAKFPALRFKRLNVTNAFHSTLVEAFRPELCKAGEGLTFNAPTIALERATEKRTEGGFSADFFADHLRNPVYFSHAVHRLAEQHPNAIWLEAGSNATVTLMASKALGAPDSHHFQAVNISGAQGLQKLVDTTTSLWKAGLRVSFLGHSRGQTYAYSPLLLPPYQFDKQKHWLELKEPPKLTAASAQQQQDATLWTFAGYQDGERRHARFRINTADPAYEAIVAGHTIAGTAPICPATVQIDVAIEALGSLHAPSSQLPRVRNVVNLVPVCVDPARSVWLDLEALDAGRRTWSWKMTSTGAAAGAAPTTHVTGELVLRGDDEQDEAVRRRAGLVSHERCLQLLRSDDADEAIQGSRSIYRVFSEIVGYGEQYFGLQKLVGKGHESAGRVVKKHSGRAGALDAFLADVFCQVGGIWVNCMTDRDPAEMYIANGIGEWVRFADAAPQAEEWHVFAQHARAADGNSFLTDVFVFDAATGALAEAVLGINYAKVSLASMRKLLTRLTASSAASAVAVVEPHPVASQPLAAVTAKKVRRSSAETVKKLKEILAEISGLEVEEIMDDVELADVGVDSLMGMEMAREIEIGFKCTLPQEDLVHVTDFPSLLKCLNSALDADGTESSDGGESSDGAELESPAHDSGYGTPAPEDAKAARPLPPLPAAIVAKAADVLVRDPAANAAPQTPDDSAQDAPVRKSTDYRFRVSPSDVYASMKRVGIQHGPIFQNIKAVRARESGSLATLEVVDTASTMPYQHEHEHVIHPTTLDSVFQAVYAALPDAGANMASAQVPRTIKNLWIAGDISSVPGTKYRAISDVRDLDKQGFKADVKVVNDGADDDDVVIKIDDFFFQSIGGALGGGDPCENDKFLTPKWVPDLALTPPALLQQQLAQEPADGEPLDRSRRQLAELVGLVAHKSPRARILEIGAGDGAATRHALHALGASADDPLAQVYDFTDASDEGFAAAADEFQAWQSLVSFKTLDIEQAPAPQGFEEGSYDLVLAGQALHRTPSLAATLANVRALLKPGGKLLLVEPTGDADQGTWDAELKSGGFTGVDLQVPGSEYTVMLSSADGPARSYHPEVVIATPAEALPQGWVDRLAGAVGALTGAAPAVQPYDNLDCEGKVVVFVGDLSGSVLTRPDDAQFEAIRALCTASRGVLWVTRGGAVDSNDPFASLAYGFARVLRLEYVGKRIGTLDLDPRRDDIWSAPAADAIASVFSELFADPSAPPSDPRDYEFAERDGQIRILRYFKDHDRNRTWFPGPADAAATTPQPFHNLRLTVDNPGQLDSLVFARSPPSGRLAEDEVEIAPRAFGISPRDVGVATGALQQDRRTGFECAGVVTRAGPRSGFAPGDRVAALLSGGDGIAGAVRAKHTSAVRIPDDMGFEMAAALPVAFATAWVALADAARLEAGERVLVHDAASAVGQAAASLAANVFGAEVFVTVAGPEQTAFVRQVLGLPRERIFSGADASFAPAVVAATQGRGVDVVVNTLEGSLLQESLGCVAELGRFVELGSRDLEQSSRLDMGALRRGVSFSVVDLAALAERKGPQVNRALTAVVDLIKARRIRGVPVSRHDISDVVQAFRTASSGKSQGKVVLSVKEDSLVPALPQAPVAKLRADGSYVVVGGFGGIGQSICYWLAEHGARNIVVLSRSASAADKAGPLLAELERMGVKVKPVSCDIADEADVKRAAAACSDMPPVRGVIQGAMVLRDSILEQMSLADYTAGLRPKVQGTWNLHTAFSSAPLDFFVILSSVAGVIGIASQCNYGAGGAFQDALAKWRTSQGLPAVSIDIGAVKNVGYVAEHDETNVYLKKQGHMILSEGDVLKAIECAVTDPYATQLVFGINTSPASAFWDEGGPAARDLRFWPAKFRGGDDDAGADGAGGQADNLAGRIARAKTVDEAAAAVAVDITAKLMDIFMMPEDEVAPNKPMAEFGVDSLTAVELRNTLALKAAAEISIFDIMQSPSLTALAKTIAVKSAHINPALAAASA
ncbi:Type I Iterative PKS [Diplodia intermedia]|uniref:Type I Iterative PKS n=1 Tax=Diplodia intermedia TaxID=856260 RepID=A0ABR3TRB9_9PEZI